MTGIPTTSRHFSTGAMQDIDTFVGLTSTRKTYSLSTKHSEQQRTFSAYCLATDYTCFGVSDGSTRFGNVHLLILQCRCPLESGMDNDIMILLTAYQRNLEFLSIGPLHPCAFANVLKPYLPWPMFLETLVVPWRLMSRQDTDFCQQVIEQSPQSLRALTVRAHCYGDGTGFRQQEFDTTRLPLDLFKHVDSFEGERKTEIHELNLQNQNLSGCKTTWIKYVDFCKLKTLQVWNCDGLDELLAEMENISREHNMQLHGLVLSLEEGFTTPVRVENFLSMTARLSYLHAAYVADTTAVGFPGFDIKCLRPHAATLKDLLLGIGSNGEFWHLHVPSIADIEWLTTTCTKLRQLAIPLPGITLKNAFSGQWGDCGTALLRLASLPRLKILRILTWPHVAADPLVDTMASINRRFSPGREKYLQSLHTIADSIARLFHQIRDEHADRLSVIMFGHTEAEQWVKDESGTGRMFFDLPITYKVRRVMTEFGLRTIVERIEPQEMKYEEPIAYVVDEDTDQGLSLEAYLSKKL